MSGKSNSDGRSDSNPHPHGHKKITTFLTSSSVGFCFIECAGLSIKVPDYYSCSNVVDHLQILKFGI